MLYAAYQALDDLTLPLRRAACLTAGLWEPLVERSWYGSLPRRLTAFLEVMGQSGLSHSRPAFGIDEVAVGGRLVPVAETVAAATPFATLLHFRKEGAPRQPPVLLVAPLSGHFSTLLRGTVETLLPDHEVYITDWHNARDVPLEHGAFGLDDYIEHVIRFLEAIGPGVHVMAVCQPCVQVLAAAAVMAEDRNPALPRSMTLMAGPIDARINPTEVNRLASQRPVAWFERNVVARVPPRFPGAGRAVYPGFVQLGAFISMNPSRHLDAHRKLQGHIARGERDEADAIESFYDEYCAVLDLPAEFYLETVQRVFQEHQLPRGTMAFRGRRIDPAAIRRTALLTVEGERDDICGIGQTMAAQDLCSGIRPHLKHHHLQIGAGHYGVFSGRRWRGEIYPLVQQMIEATAV